MARANYIRTKDKSIPVIEVVDADYMPSAEAWAFHNAIQRFRMLIWGVKSGKTFAGAIEACRFALENPGQLNWVVAPTYLHLQVAERELLRVLHRNGMVKNHLRAKHEIHLKNGGLIQLRSADYPDHLRGPNIEGFLWIDEGSFLKLDAWHILLERVSATEADIFTTTTPHGRNWVWAECIQGGMPAAGDYGEFFTDEYFISHRPTWHFPWVRQKEIDRMRGKMSKEKFDQECGAMFVSMASIVFRYVEDATTYEQPYFDKDKVKLVMGLDLAKKQDWTAYVLMDGFGRVYKTDRWEKTDYKIQEKRIEKIAKKYEASLCVDSSNAGTRVCEEFRSMGLNVYEVDMNSSVIKNELIENLQIAFENKEIKLIDPKANWASRTDEALINELGWYESGLTNSQNRNITYSAPQGFNDDTVIALALALHGKNRGYAGGSSAAADCIISRQQMEINLKKQKIIMKKPRVHRRMYARHRNALGMESGYMYRG